MPSQTSLQRYHQHKWLYMTTAKSIADYPLKTYRHNDWELAYRYKPASPGYERSPPVILIHPVGIGLSCWFWENLFQEWKDGPALYAPDLIGCGQSQTWDPKERDLPLPLGWVQGVQGLIHELASSSATTNSNAEVEEDTAFKCTIVSQGGLAPVGVLLAFQNQTAVQNLILTSPPTFQDMTTAIPKDELERNYAFFTNPISSGISFHILERPWAVRFFSNLFLFSNQCDDKWVDTACGETGVAFRPPVAAFNSGFCNERSFQEEMKGLNARVLVLSGKDDKRTTDRTGYKEIMKDCSLLSLPGTNVMPWESPKETAEAIRDFMGA